MTDEEAIDHAKALKEYCIEQLSEKKYCVECPLRSVGCEYESPDEWNFPDETKGEQ